MPESADLYEILQVHPAAHPEVIQAAYRRLAQIYHPDRNPAPDASERMAEINAAYAVLNDPQQRAAYDRQRAGGGNSRDGTAAVHDVVRAKSFQLVNDAGQTRAEMSLDADGDPMMFMNDRNGNRRFAISQTTASGQFRLVINDQHGKARLWIGESNEGRPMLYLTDRNGNRRFGIYQGEDGSQWLRIVDRGDKTRLFVGEADDGTPMLYMADIDGDRRLEIHQDNYGSQELVFYDADDDIAARIGEDT